MGKYKSYCTCTKETRIKLNWSRQFFNPLSRLRGENVGNNNITLWGEKNNDSKQILKRTKQVLISTTKKRETKPKPRANYS